MPTRVAVEPTIISCAPPISAFCIWVSLPRLALAKPRAFNLLPVRLARSSAKNFTARPWLLSSARP
jgi:hypothetical protein